MHFVEYGTTQNAKKFLDELYFMCDGHEDYRDSEYHNILKITISVICILKLTLTGEKL
jgi:hypothetical protein